MATPTTASPTPTTSVGFQSVAANPDSRLMPTMLAANRSMPPTATGSSPSKTMPSSATTSPMTSGIGHGLARVYWSLSPCSVRSAIHRGSVGGVRNPPVRSQRHDGVRHQEPEVQRDEHGERAQPERPEVLGLGLVGRLVGRALAVVERAVVFEAPVEVPQALGREALAAARARGVGRLAVSTRRAAGRVVGVAGRFGHRNGGLPA